MHQFSSGKIAFPKVRSLVLLLPLVHTCRGRECPVPHECQGVGLEELSSGTGEAAFCLAQGATPICPGIDINGNPISVTTTPPVTTTTPPVTTTTPPVTTTTPPVTTTTPPVTTNTPPVTTTTPPVTTVTPPVTTITPPVTTTTPPVTTITPPVNTTTPPVTTTPQGPSCEEVSCEGKSEGVYAHPECDCQRYYTCVTSVSGNNLILSQYRCTGNKVFDQDTYECVRDRSKCP
ncbi:uncharacterized protein [Panulirus ornatus]|uniref:uncharacterized protein n=1 Tax=Panulirus ornatus TaxID=150431 RepID=UPI003A86852E